MELNSSETTLHWFAVYTKPKTEKKVAKRLTQAGFESFLPLQTEIRQWSDRKKKVKVPLINSYVFVQSYSTNIYEVYKVPGVINILTYLNKYAIVKDSEIENLRILIKSGLPMQTLNTPINLSKGTNVTITKGPFQGLFATYLTTAGKHKVIVTLET